MKIVLYLPKLWNDEPRIKAVTEKIHVLHKNSIYLKWKEKLDKGS